MQLRQFRQGLKPCGLAALSPIEFSRTETGILISGKMGKLSKSLTRILRMERISQIFKVLFAKFALLAQFAFQIFDFEKIMSFVPPLIMPCNPCWYNFF